MLVHADRRPSHDEGRPSHQAACRDTAARAAQAGQRAREAPRAPQAPAQAPQGKHPLAKPHGTLGGRAARRPRIAARTLPRAGSRPSARRRSRSPRRAGCCGARASGRPPGRPRRSSGSPWNRSSSASPAPPGAATLTGPEPVNEEGEKLEPEDVWGDDHCWWLDRMLRSDQQLVERMTFIFHDWFANSNEKVNSQRMMLEQNELFRSMCFGSFHDLFLAVTTNPAMLVFLDGIYNEKGNTNENYGARDDGAVLARRRPRRLHPGRRARHGARADRLAGGMDRKQRPAELPLRPRSP